jgi:hypothetical protein
MMPGMHVVALAQAWVLGVCSNEVGRDLRGIEAHGVIAVEGR